MGMQKHPTNRRRKITSKIAPQRQRKQRRKRKAASDKPLKGSDDIGGFLSLLLRRIGWEELEELNQRKHRAGRPVNRLSRGQLLAALVFHYTVSWAGSFTEHLFCLLSIQMANSTLSERRQVLPFEVFAQLLRRVLSPISGAPAQACYRQWRLVAIDGVSFSLANTAPVKKKCKRGRNQKGLAAFAKLQCAALVELVMHNPLAAAVGTAGESEWKLALGLLDQLPDQCLLLADRLYGYGAFLVAAMERLKPRNGHFLVRVKEGHKVTRRIKRLRDGSRLVEIQAVDPANRYRVVATPQVREIYATIQRRGHRSVRVRLWTSLSLTEASAQALVRLYMTRWEQELYFRELKWQLGINDLLRSQTPETAAQEVVAMIIGSSLIAHERATLRPGEELAHRISFIKTRELLEPLWLVLLLGADILSEAQKQALTDRFHAQAARLVMAKKRARCCPRAMRQPIQPWPRKKNQKTVEGTLHFNILRHS
jgi:hypothetical protein